jgi:hypothetical protein
MAKQTFTTGQVLTAAQMTSLQETAMGGGPASTKTASYVLVAADAGTTVAMNAAGATTITVNTGLFSAGDTVFIQNIGAGACTITAGTATVSTAGSLILPQYDAGILYFTSASAAIFYDYIQAGAASPLTTKGDLYTFSTSDARLPVGTNGQYLAANSAQATGLEWVTASSGGMTQLASGTMSGSATIRLQSIPGTYKFLRLYIRNHIATNTNLSLRFRLNNDSSANVYASGGELGQNISETFRYTSVYCTTDLSNTTAQGMAVFTIYDYTNTSSWKMFDAQAIGNNKTTATSIQLGTVLGAYNQTGAVTEVDIFSDQGNWTGGTYNLYGVN